jgi:dTDP-4-dehydrorhamnose 3,5-epimerase
LSGRILDVIVDIRHKSPTYGKHLSVELDGAHPQWFWVPAGFAHSFFVLGEQQADVLYKVDNYWNGPGENGIVWNDPDLAISWPNMNPLMSDKDRILQTFREYQINPKF